MRWWWLQLNGKNHLALYVWDNGSFYQCSKTRTLLMVTYQSFLVIVWSSTVPGPGLSSLGIGPPPFKNNNFIMTESTRRSSNKWTENSVPRLFTLYYKLLCDCFYISSKEIISNNTKNKVQSLYETLEEANENKMWLFLCTSTFCLQQPHIQHHQPVNVMHFRLVG